MVKASDDQRARQAQSDSEQAGRHRRARVSEVAQHHHMLRTDRVDQFGETPKRLLADAGRRGRAKRAEGRRLAKMEIGDKQGLRGRREGGAFGQEFQDSGAHSLKRVQASAAFSSCATIRSMRADKVSFDSRSRMRWTINGNPNGVGRLRRADFEPARRHSLKRRLHPPHVEFILEHFPLGLFEKPIGGVVFAKHVVKRVLTTPASRSSCAARPETRAKRGPRYGRCRGSADAPVRQR